MNIFAIAVVSLIASILSQMLKRYNSEMSTLLPIMTGIVVSFVVLMQVAPVIKTIEELIAKTQIESEQTVVLFKCLGICLLTDFSSSACSDAGEGSIASRVEFAGKVAILVVAMPLFKSVLEVATGLI